MFLGGSCFLECHTIFSHLEKVLVQMESVTFLACQHPLQILLYPKYWGNMLISGVFLVGVGWYWGLNSGLTLVLDQNYTAWTTSLVLYTCFESRWTSMHVSLLKFCDHGAIMNAIFEWGSRTWNTRGCGSLLIFLLHWDPSVFQCLMIITYR
jgi:hypothetical protein